MSNVIDICDDECLTSYKLYYNKIIIIIIDQNVYLNLNNNKITQLYQ